MVVSGGEWWRLMAVVSGGQWWWPVGRVGLASGVVMAPPPPSPPHMADPTLLLGTWAPRTSICTSFDVPSVGDNAVPVQKV